MDCDFLPRLTAWFRAAGRKLPFRECGDPYKVLVSETMAQQTRMTALVPYYERFTARFPDIRALAGADEADVLALWAGLGYYSRARALHKAAKAVCEHWNGALPDDAQALRALPGVGEYTAGAVASIAFNKPVPAVDGNVRRVYARLLARDGGDVTAWVRTLMEKAPPRLVTESLMELGALICVPSSPKCGECPVMIHCEAFQTGRAAEFPARRVKPPKREEERVICLVRDAGGRVLLRRRNERLLHNMWEFPSEEQLRRDGFAVSRRPEPLGSASHAFTHLIWRMAAYAASAERDGLPENYRRTEDWEKLPIPSAMNAWKVLLKEEKWGILP